jgi:vacuolar-type H+-ATPase subunit H
VFTEELTAIREAEEQSEAIKKNVKAEAKRMIEAAKAEAEKILDDEETKAKEIYDSLIREGMDEADTEYGAAIEKAHIDAENMVKAAEAKKDKVIDHIVERIVRSGVNS